MRGDKSASVLLHYTTRRTWTKHKWKPDLHITRQKDRRMSASAISVLLCCTVRQKRNNFPGSSNLEF